MSNEDVQQAIVDAGRQLAAEAAERRKAMWGWILVFAMLALVSVGVVMGLISAATDYINS